MSRIFPRNFPRNFLGLLYESLEILENYYNLQKNRGIDTRRIVRGWVNLFNKQKGAKKWRTMLGEGQTPMATYQSIFCSWIFPTLILRTAAIAKISVETLKPSQMQLQIKFSAGSEITLTIASVMKNQIIKVSHWSERNRPWNNPGRRGIRGKTFNQSSEPSRKG